VSNQKWTLVPALLALLLASCAQPVRAPSPSTSTPVPASDVEGADVYAISPEDSQLHILVYRGGKLARFGHNHVVASKAISGRAWLHPRFERSGFELSIPVQSLIVDDPQARQAEGVDFPPGISAKDVEGTRRNMLREEVLDAERFPNLSLRSVNVAGSLQSPQITARITIKDVSRDIEVPAQLAIERGQLTARGELDILQTDFGIKPFSMGLGALEVQDRLHLKFVLVARRLPT
jgi:polyisoprenoid-binding protein YceI